MIKIDNDKVLLLHQLIIESSGGSYELRDKGLLDSAINNAFQTFGGVDLYPTKEEKGAMLGYNLVSNHAFVDGNKRIGLLVMLSFFEINGVYLTYTDDDLIEIGLSLADGTMKYNDLLNWVKAHKLK